ncbi:MAG: phosphate ABC transporter permease PstA [Candidatus Methanofastidiosia archaeon]
MRGKEFLVINLFRLSLILVIAVTVFILFDIISKGIGIMSFTFLLDIPRNSMTEGGIFPAIVGTIYVVLLMILFSLPLGVFAGIYLVEYARGSKITTLIRIGVNNLAGVPSIVFGLFGLGFFVLFIGPIFGFEACLLSASLTLALLVLPTIIVTTEEALKSVPMEYKEASFALGASKWQTIQKISLPYSLPGILTGAILAIGRGAGETAPILFTGAAYFLPRIPHSPFDKFMELSYHIFIMATQSINPTETLPIQYGTTLTLLGVILLMDFGAILLRRYFRKKRGVRWR